MRRFQTWHWLLLLMFTAFWMLMAVILITNNFPFLIALTTLALLSSLVIALAWAFQNNI